MLFFGIVSLTLIPSVSFTDGVLFLWIFLASLIGGGFAIYGFARERFVSPEDESLEGWPFKNISRMKMGMWTFLGSEVIFFGVFLSAYIFIRAGTADWPAIDTVFKIQHGAINTFILLTSSFTAVLAVVFSKQGSRGGLIGSLAATFGLALWFLYNKATEWQELIHEGFIFSSSPVSSTYYVTTGAHGAHVIGGLVALAVLLGGAMRGRYLKHEHGTIEFFGLYWHFVDIVWIFLFPLFYLL